MDGAKRKLWKLTADGADIADAFRNALIRGIRVIRGWDLH